MMTQIHYEAENLFEIARQQNLLEECYVVSNKLSHGIPWDEIELSDEIIAFRDYIPEKNQKLVLEAFVRLLREELKIVNVEVVSAVALAPEQLRKLEIKLIQLLHKRVGINHVVDKSIIGGLKVTFGNTVIDNSIKNQLMSLKEDLYKGVYFNSDI